MREEREGEKERRGGRKAMGVEIAVLRRFDNADLESSEMGNGGRGGIDGQCLGGEYASLLESHF